ncbi:CBBY-like protein [Physcomitrium patens]
MCGTGCAQAQRCVCLLRLWKQFCNSAMSMAGMATLQSVLFASPAVTTSSSSNCGFFRGGKFSSCRLVAHAGRLQRNGAWRMKVVSALPDALLFDCDGVLVDTERDGHRISFNKAFEEKGLQVAWDVALYGKLLEIGGGKERMTHYFNGVGWPASVEEAQRKDFVAGLHKRKTDLFMDLVETGQLPLRPGVASLIDQALDKGVQVAVCSTSNERAVSAIVRVMLGDKRAAAMKIFAGDVVPKKKPDPAIYQLAATTLNVQPEKCVVIEDSHIGVTSAKAAGMVCIVTKSGYTENEDFSEADAVFPCIGDPPSQNFDLDFASSLLMEKKLA